MKWLLLIPVGAAGLFGADLNGRWNFIWQTPGGERRSTLSFKQNADKVEARFLFTRASRPKQNSMEMFLS